MLSAVATTCAVADWVLPAPLGLALQRLLLPCDGAGAGVAQPPAACRVRNTRSKRRANGRTAVSGSGPVPRSSCARVSSPPPGSSVNTDAVKVSLPSPSSVSATRTPTARRVQGMALHCPCVPLTPPSSTRCKSRSLLISVCSRAHTSMPLTSRGRCRSSTDQTSPVSRSTQRRETTPKRPVHALDWVLTADDHRTGT